jgi:hypothetical protein
MPKGKTAGKTPVARPPELVPQPHGGALLAGGVPGNRGNPASKGPPKSAIREKLAAIVNDHGVDYVRRVLTGEEEGATIQNRLDAFEKAAKFGVGALKSVDEDDIRARLKATVEIITAELPPDVAEALLAKVEVVWR